MCLSLKSQVNGLKSEVHSFSFTLSKLTSQLTLPNSIFTNSMHSWKYLLLDYQHIRWQIPSEDAYITPLTSRGSNVSVSLVKIIKLGLHSIQIMVGTLKIIQKLLSTHLTCYFILKMEASLTLNSLLTGRNFKKEKKWWKFSCLFYRLRLCSWPLKYTFKKKKGGKSISPWSCCISQEEIN